MVLRQRTVQHVKGLDGMTDIHDLRFRSDVENHSLDRSYEVVVEPEISSQGDDRSIGQWFLVSAMQDVRATAKVTRCCGSSQGGAFWSDALIAYRLRRKGAANRR